MSKRLFDELMAALDMIQDYGEEDVTETIYHLMTEFEMCR